MPDFPVIDAHVHLYDPANLKHSWMAGLPKLNRRHDMSDLDRERGEVEIEKLVFVEVWADFWGQHIDEARWVDSLAEDDPRIAGIVAAVPIEFGGRVEDDLKTLAAIPRVKGVRRLVEAEPDTPGFCTTDAFIEGVRLLPRHGLSFDLCVKHWQMKDGIELVRQCPETSFVLDHIGKPPIKDQTMEPWASQLKELASFDNVFCKISGVITEADHANWTPDHLRPYIDHALDSFGFDRVMYGSDWTVAKLTHDYPTWVRILDEVTKDRTPTERQNLFHNNARRFYRL